MRVVKQYEGGIVGREVVLDDAGDEIALVTRFLSHLSDAGYSPNTVCAYAYDLRHLARFLDDRSVGWDDFRPATALEFLGYLRQLPSARPAQRLGLTVATEHGRLLSAATVQRVLAATSSFFDWAIAAEEYTSGENPMQQRVDLALGRVPDRHQPFVGVPSRQQPVRRTVRVRLPLRLPRPMSSQDIESVLARLTTLRDLAIFLLMLDGGLRPGEVLCLRLDDISYGRRRVTIRKRDDHPRGARAKSRQERVVDLHEPRTLDAVNRYASTYGWAFLFSQSLMPALNALLLGSLFYRSRLVPRALPTLGLIGAPAAGLGPRDTVRHFRLHLRPGPAPRHPNRRLGVLPRRLPDRQRLQALPDHRGTHRRRQETVRRVEAHSAVASEPRRPHECNRRPIARSDR